MFLLLLGAVSLLGFGSNSIPVSAPCAVQGAWTLESVATDGKPNPLGKRRQIKIISPTHYAWVSQEPGPTVVRSLADSLAAFRTGSFGGGTYRVTDSTYTERLEYFFDPAYVGREITISCRISGNRWQHAYQWPVLENGRETGHVRVEEVWRRVP